MDVLCCTASILHLVAIAIDRYWAITKLNYVRTRTTKPILLMIAIVWVTALGISLPTRFHYSRNEYQVLVEGQCQINDDYAFTIISTVGAFYLPMAFLIGVYAKIYQAAQKRIRKRRFRISTVNPLMYGSQKQGNGLREKNSEKSVGESWRAHIKAKLAMISRLKTTSWKRKQLHGEFTRVSYETGFADQTEDTSEHDVSITFNDDFSPTSNNSSSFCSSSNQKSSLSGTSDCYFGTQVTSTRVTVPIGKINQECHSPIKCSPNCKPIVVSEENHHMEPQNSALGPVLICSAKAESTKQDSDFQQAEEMNEDLVAKSKPITMSRLPFLPKYSSSEYDSSSDYSRLTVEQEWENETFPCSVSHSDLSIVLRRKALFDSDSDTISNVSHINGTFDQTNGAKEVLPKQSSSFHQYELVTSPLVIEFNLCSESGSGSTLHKSIPSTQSVSPRPTGLCLTDRGAVFPCSPFLYSSQSTPSVHSVNTNRSLSSDSDFTNGSSESGLEAPARKFNCGPEEDTGSLYRLAQHSEQMITSPLVPNGYLASRNNFYSEKQQTAVKPSQKDKVNESNQMISPKPSLTQNSRSQLDTVQNKPFATTAPVNEIPAATNAVLNRIVNSPETLTMNRDTSKSPLFREPNQTCLTASHVTLAYKTNHIKISHETATNHVAAAFPGANNAILEAEHHRERVESRRERKAARTLAIITGCFILCWFPFFARALYAPFCMPTCSLPSWVESLLLWLGYLNSLLNPVLYTVFSPDFRSAFKKIVCGRLSIRAN